jgi:Fe-S cluster biogenesis protein NfuA/nitrite reductase/ring-hydroxylating ferredoxin subunit
MAEYGVALDDGAARERVARVEALLADVEALADPGARETATDLVQALLDLYGEGLARLVGHVAERDADGALAAALAGDELVAHLLLLHELHPVPLEARVRGALDEVRPYLESHGGNVELLGVEEGVARLRLEGSCNGCPSSTATLKLAIEDAIHKAAPDIQAIEAEGAVEPAPAPAPLLQIELADALRRPAEAEADGAAWAAAGPAAEVPADRPVLREVAGEPVLFLALDGGGVYAYRPACPACTAPLGDGALDGAVLSCAGCGARFDARRAGRSLAGDDVHLEPVPLLVDADGAVKVALGAAAA